jgi:hypothetical protein
VYVRTSQANDANAARPCPQTNEPIPRQHVLCLEGPFWYYPPADILDLQCRFILSGFPMNILYAFLNVKSWPGRRRGLFKPQVGSIEFRNAEYYKPMYLCLVRFVINSGIKDDGLSGYDTVCVLAGR